MEENMEDVIPQESRLEDAGRFRLGAAGFGLATGAAVALGPETSCVVLGLPVNAATVTAAVTIGLVTALRSLAALLMEQGERG